MSDGASDQPKQQEQDPPAATGTEEDDGDDVFAPDFHLKESGLTKGLAKAVHAVSERTERTMQAAKEATLQSIAALTKKSKTRLGLDRPADATQSGGMDDLIVSAETGDAETVKLIIESTQRPNALDIAGFSAMHYACAQGHVAVVRVLLELGADINLPSLGKELTPLHCACNGGHLNVVEELLRHEIIASSINFPAGNSKSLPLHCAAHCAKPDAEEIVSLLLRAGAEADALDAFGCTPLIYVTRRGKYDGAVKTLLENGANPQSKDADDISALHYAVLEKNVDMVRMLIGAGATVESPTGAGAPLPPLYLACRDGNTEMCSLLIKAGADVNQLTNKGRSCLLAAVGTNNVELVALLAKSGADVDCKGPSGLTLFAEACIAGRPNMADFFLKLGADPNAPVDHEEATPLHYGVRRGYEQLVKMLLDAPTVDVSKPDDFGRTALHWAVFFNNIPVVEALLKRGAKPSPDENGTTPASIAAAKNRPQLAEKLVAVGDAVDSKVTVESLKMYWQDKTSFPTCILCKKKFNVLGGVVRNHCRLCANIVCKQCCTELPLSHPLTGIKICRQCYNLELKLMAASGGKSDRSTKAAQSATAIRFVPKARKDSNTDDDSDMSDDELTMPAPAPTAQPDEAQPTEEAAQQAGDASAGPASLDITMPKYERDALFEDEEEEEDDAAPAAEAE